MTDLELSGRVLPALPDPDADRVTQLTAAWLARRTKNTQREYRADLTHWWQWCARLGVDPLAARMMHMDAWIAYQRAHGVRGDGLPAAEASIARRVAAVSSWYKYLYRNTKDDPRPASVHEPRRHRRPAGHRPRQLRDRRAQHGRGRPAVPRRRRRRAPVLRPHPAAAVRRPPLRLRAVRGHRRPRPRPRLPDPHRPRQRRQDPPRPHPARARRRDRRLPRRPRQPGRGCCSSPAPAAGSASRTCTTSSAASPARLASPRPTSCPRTSLRHTFATDYLDAGGNLRDLQDAMGHADPRTTRRYDRSRHNLDRHPAHVLATRFGARRDT